MTGLDVAVVLFAVTGFIHLVIGILSGIIFLVTPAHVELSPRLGPRYVFFNVEPDEVLYGEPPAELLRRDRALAVFRRIAILVMAALLVGLGTIELAVTWFALREGEAWALGALTIAGLGMLPFYGGIFRTYLAAGARLRLSDVPPFIWVPAAVLLPAAVLGWLGLPVS